MKIFYKDRLSNGVTGKSMAAKNGSGAAIEVKNMSHSFRHMGHVVPVLDDVSFTVAPGEFVTVMGASGCGKSTLLNILAGFVRPTAGTVACHGYQIARPGRERGMVLQTPALYPWFSVMDNVLFGPRAQGRCSTKQNRAQETEKARALLREIGLESYEDYPTYKLSGGMKHRVAIARTLIAEPEVLLMDEPFAALDAQTRLDMQDVLLSIWETHHPTVVFVTHDIEEGLLLADRTLVLSSGPGRIIQEVQIAAGRPRSTEIAMQQDFIELRHSVRNLLRKTNASSNSK